MAAAVKYIMSIDRAEAAIAASLFGFITEGGEEEREEGERGGRDTMLLGDTRFGGIEVASRT